MDSLKKKLIPSAPLTADAPPHLWSFPLSFVEPSLFSLLEERERERAEKFRFAKGRLTFVQVRGILRLLLGHYLEKDPSHIKLAYNKFGKPHLASSEASEVAFSISHSGDRALIAFTARGSIGVDLEYCCRQSAEDYRDIAQRFFAPEEIELLFQLPITEQKRAFFDCWTLKESFIKAVGKGLSLSLQSFAVHFPPWGKGELIRPKQSKWCVSSLPLLARNYSAALTLDKPATPLIFFR